MEEEWWNCKLEEDLKVKLERNCEITENASRNRWAVEQQILHRWMQLEVWGADNVRERDTECSLMEIATEISHGNMIN